MSEVTVRLTKDGPSRYRLNGGPTLVTGDEFPLPDSQRSKFENLEGFEVIELETTEYCDEIQGNGDVCGREEPCHYHGD